MSGYEIAAACLLVMGIAGCALTALGLLVSGDAYDQIHYLAPASLLGSVAIPLAVLLHEGWWQAGLKALAIGMILVLSNPVLSHATARAARIRRKSRVEPHGEEHIPFGEDAE
jgi:monovalent cation/proton antiporter MnhG/PhaG subunit